MRIGVLTAGGDCPGLNAVIRSVVHRAVDNYGDEVIGFEDGYSGLLDGRYRTLDLNAVSGILARGGTILGSSRLERDRLREACENASDMIHEFGIDALIPIGGEGTLTAARMLSDAGLPVVGVPKTIDNDISSTDRTFGFDTAVGVATEAMDRLKTTAESHQRVMVVEVMGGTRAGSPWSPAWRPAPTASACPSGPSTRPSWSRWSRSASTGARSSR